MFKRLLVFLFLFFLSAECTSPPPPETKSLPKKLGEILSNETPLSLYIETYSTFRFTSYSVLVLPENPTGKLEGRTMFERDSRGNYHLTRVPLMDQPPLELFHFDQKAFLRFGNESEFRPIDHQPEFDRWASKSFREVFSLYQKNGFTGDEAATSKGNLTCRTKGEGAICTDPASGLPVSGAIRVRLDDRSVLESRFSLAPADTRPVVILPPAAKSAAAPVKEPTPATPSVKPKKGAKKR